MSLFVVDVESDNKSPASGSMVCFGAVRVDEKLSKTFYGMTRPITDKWNPEALAISGFSRKEHEDFDNPKRVMLEFSKWVNEHNIDDRPTFLSDNNGFDWMWICYYFDLYGIDNPFGYSSRRIGDIYCGLTRNLRNNRRWKRLRKTRHNHNPVNDAVGNAEAFLTFWNV